MASGSAGRGGPGHRALRWPEPWPGDGLLAMRVAVVSHRAGRGRQFAREALRVHFRDGRPLGEPKAIACALERAGLDPESTLEQAQDQLVKQELRERTARAIALGVSGVPSLIVDGNVFWGDDRLADAARAMLAGEENP